MSKKHTNEYIDKYFKDRDCEWLGNEYKNNKTKLRYRCSCGNEAEIKFNSFKSGCRCRKCGIEKRTEARKHTNEYIQKYFKDHDCEALEPYINALTPIRYRCSCGNESKIRFNDFRQGQRCTKCGGNEKYTDKYIQQCFRDHGCKALGKYINNHTPMRYICECGNEATITFSDFQRGGRCKKCGYEKVSKALYNPNLTDEHRLIKRNTVENRDWRKAIFKQDNYTCQKCGQYGNELRAHHIENYAKNEELRANINNGITFCKDCHKNFHHQYGLNCNRKQLIEFLGSA